LLLQYDYSKSSDPLQPFAAHISSLLTRDHPQTWDIVVTDGEESLFLHKFILAARSPYFRKKLATSPGSSSLRLPSAIPPQAFGAAIKYLYLGEAPRDLRSGPGTGYTESEVVAGIDKIGKYLEIPHLLDSILDSGDRRLSRQRRTAEVARGRDQLESWFRENVLANKVVVDTSKANDVKWDRNNALFADVLLRADEVIEDGEDNQKTKTQEDGTASSIPVGPGASAVEDAGAVFKQKSVLYPVHRAMLLRSEFFNAMFSSTFKEAQVSEHLNIIHVDCSPEVLEIVLTYFYTERADFSLDIAVDVLFAADLLFIEKLKTKAAVVISSLGSGNLSQAQASKTRPKKQTGLAKGAVDVAAEEAEEIDIYEIIRAAWLTRVQRLEEFGARYLAYRLEEYIDSPEFAELIKESAARIQRREETDSIELLDDIRFYLSERFRLRFDDTGLVELMTANAPKNWYAKTKEETQEVSANGQLLDVPTKEGDKTAGEVVSHTPAPETQPVAAQVPEHGPIIKTLDGDVVEDEFDSDAINYQILLEKLDRLLEKLNLDA
jgi:ankyrin repeat/BTB/POZ domain-containing protein 1